MTGVVFDIKEFAVFDGPGIRTTVFLKGCPLRCQWCHNPEGQSPEPELMISRASCTHCGACARVCRHPDRCTLCGACIPACRSGCRRVCGVLWQTEELAARLQKDADVYMSSGGGVTFSGGEPLMQWPFVAETIRRMSGIHTAVETSGYADDCVFQEAMRTCALILMDWKVSDPEKHLHFTGVPQEPILRHVQMLAGGSTPFILRMPIIPGVNDEPEHFETAARLVAGSRNLVRVDLLPYNRAAGAKYEMVGKTYAPEFPEQDVPRVFPEPFRRRGIPYQLFH